MPLQLAPLVFQRPSKLRCMEWAEVDLAAAVWTIPAPKMKRTRDDKLNGAPHDVPLSAQALAILRNSQSLTGAGNTSSPTCAVGIGPCST